MPASETILIVDDDERVLQTFSRNLGMLGYDVLTALEGESALGLYEQHHPNIVMVDVRMPKMDGFEVLARLHEQDHDAEVILVTGHGDMDMAIAALRAGASDFIPKPVEQTVLDSVLRHAQERLRLKRELREAEAALRRANDELEMRVAARTEELSQTNTRLQSEIAERSQLQKQYEDLVNSIDGIVWEADARSYQFTFVSQKAESLLGYPVAQWVDEADFWKTHIHPEDRQATVDFCMMATRHQMDHELEYRMLTADGGIVWLRDIVSVVGGKGHPDKLRGVMIDITDHRRMEDRLSAVYQLGRELTLLHDEAAIIQRTLEIAAQVIRFDFANCSLVDTQRHALIQRYAWLDNKLHDAELRLPLDGDKGISVAVVQSKQALNVPDTRRDARYVSMCNDVISRSELCVPMLVGEDVSGVLNIESEQVNAFATSDEQLLQTLASQTAVALENARLYTAIQRNARELAAINNAIQAMTANLALSTVLQKAIDEIHTLLDAEDASVLLYDVKGDDLVFAAVASPHTATLLFGQHLPNGQGIAGWVLEQQQPALVNHVQQDPRFYADIDSITGVVTHSLLAVPLIVKERVIGVIEVINKRHANFSSHDMELLETLASSAAIAIDNARLYQNVQDQMRLLQETQSQLMHSEKIAALGRLVASISHEINNPLQSIQGCLTLADEELQGDRRQQKLERYLKVAEEEIERIAAIVRRVRDFYRPAPQEQYPTDLHEVLMSVLELSGKQLQHSDVVVERVWAEDLPLVKANADHLKQVFLNLVLNAIDAMPEGGTLYLHTFEDANNIHIEFADTGIGMSEETQARLFEPFFTTKPQGSGLGLSISYGIIEAHKGKIVVDSQLGVGTTFTITLPTYSPTETS